jgi:hypothetical protein
MKYKWNCHPYWPDCSLGDLHTGPCETLRVVDGRQQRSYSGGDYVSGNEDAALEAKANGCLVYLLL